MAGIDPTAARVCQCRNPRWSPGCYRRDDVEIPALHEPPGWREVPALVAELCRFVETRRPSGSIEPAELIDRSLFLSAFTLWRINWIHPFNDGNGRTARAAAYFVLAVGLHVDLPGNIAIHEYIENWGWFPYIDGLDEADAAWKRGVIDVRRLQELLRDATIAQLESR